MFLQEHGTVVFKFAADPETKTSSVMSPSPTPLPTSKKFTGITKASRKMENEKNSDLEVIEDFDDDVIEHPEDAEYDEYDDGPVDDIMVDEEAQRNDSVLVRRSPLDVDDGRLPRKCYINHSKYKNWNLNIPSWHYS